MRGGGRGWAGRCLPPLGGALVCTASALSAVVPPAGPPPPSSRPSPPPLVDGRLWVQPSPVPLAARPEALLAAAAWRDFEEVAGGTWTAFVDGTSGLLEYAEGSGLPWLPGRGNSLTAADLEQVPADDVETLALLELRARGVLAKLGTALGVDPARLVLAGERSGRVGDHLWVVDFDLVLDGVRVEGAHVVFRVNHGNLVQLGSSHLPSPHAREPAFLVTQEEALDRLRAAAGGFAADALFLDVGTRRLLPTNPPPGFAGALMGRGLMAVWELTFVHPGEPATWRARVDAESGELLELYDVNEYGQATGGVYPHTFAAANETPMPLPFVDLSTGGFANAAGTYAHAGGPLVSTLSGRYAKIHDSCGSISLGADHRGNLAFGSSPGTDCATPGLGGAGNTHSARSLYAWVADIQQAARGWLPGNPWLGGRLPVVANLELTCNAFWNGSSINFYRSGDGCGNTGEIADVAWHEFGHGLDSADGSSHPGEMGSGEAYGDLTAALFARDSCIGDGFYLGANCGGFGDPCLDCTGVRDVDWAKHSSGAPHTVANFVQPLCPRTNWYVGPCGAHGLALHDPDKQTQGHCESQVASEALWDLAARDLPQAGSAAAWAVLERLWYRSRASGRQAFLCDVAGPTWTSHGCGTDTWWRAMRLADDDDGNLANGTPHSCRLFAAFDRHGIACAADPGANVCFAACTPPPRPTPALLADDNRVDVSWQAGSPGEVYDLYRSPAGCDAGFAKVADDLAGTSFADGDVANYFTYSYRLIAHPAGNEACSASPSSCASAQPIPCITPGPPSQLQAGTAGDNAIALSFAGGTPAASKFNLYRGLGTCAAAGPGTAVATGLSGPSHLDAGVSGTLTYAYRVTATDETGVCESAPSACVEVTATGPCTAAPLFGGLASAVNAEQTECGIDLAWSPATALCGGPLRYDVHRSSTPGFLPSPATLVAAGLSATAYADRDGLGNRQPFEYVVRARDAANGAVEDNRIAHAAAATGPTTVVTLAETFEAAGGFDLPGWQHANLVGNPMQALDWVWVAGPEGGHGWFADEDEAPSGKVLVSPRFGIGAQTAVTFRHRFALQDSLPGGYCEDGALIEVSTDGGASWTSIPQAAFPHSAFVADVDPTDGNPLGNKRAWCGWQMGSLADVRVELGSFAGVEEARLRWYEGDDRSDAVSEPNGWYVDGVTLHDTRSTAVCTGTTVRVFDDGFESGDLSRWRPFG